MTTPTVERFHLSLKTPAGEVSTSVAVPTGFVPITAIVPMMHRLTDQAQALEAQDARDQGHVISCSKGCAACCRMLVPVSAPEAFALNRYLHTLPVPRREFFLTKVAEAKARLESDDLLDPLMRLAESDRPVSDEEMEPVNQAYYALRMPCPFLENEMCAIYEHRPSACRELMVTSPAELCQDLAKNPVQPVPVSLRMSTALGLLWSDLAGGPGKLIPLPLALDWAAHHAETGARTWGGIALLEKALDKIWQFLGQEFRNRGRTPPGPTSPAGHASP